jgi:hypothetical protein
MGLVGIEAVMNAAKTVLQTNLPAKVTALNGEYSDAYVLTDIEQYSYYDGVLSFDLFGGNFPAIVLDDGGDTADQAESNYSLYVMKYQLIVSVFVRGTGLDDLSALLRRYHRAVKEILVARHSLAPTCTDCIYSGGAAVTVTDPRSGDFLQGKAGMFIVTTAETTA